MKVGCETGERDGQPMCRSGVKQVRGMVCVDRL